MTDEDRWNDCRSVGVALQLINRATKTVRPGWKRKLRLCSCYLLRRRVPAARDGRFAHALDVAERHFDGAATLAELKAAVADAQRGYEVHRNDLEGDDERAAQDLTVLIDHTAHGAVGVAFNTAHDPFDDAWNAAGVALLREMFGNPLRPVAFAPDWRTDTAVALARTMYESRDFGAMPILADALQDAGCDSDEILSHCRGAGAGGTRPGFPQTPSCHVRGCWVVDLVLNKA